MSRESVTGGKRRGLLLWLLLAAIAALLVAVAAELAGLVYFAADERRLFYGTSLPAPSRSDRARREPLAVHRFHPYFGFALEPGVPMQRFLREPRVRGALLEGAPPGAPPPTWPERRTNDFGFFSDVEYPFDDGEAFLVGVFGGSLARSFTLQGDERLARRLSEWLARPVRVLNFAEGGYKQPQQLIILAYFLLVGQRFDLVLNIDGFNEAALGSLNASAEVDSSMPSMQHLRGLELLVRSPGSPEVRGYLSALGALREQIRALEERRARARLAARYMLADLRLGAARRRYGRLLAAPPATPDEERERLIALAGPLAGVLGADAQPAGEKIVGEWLRGSRMMDALARGAGARYVHVLQPNQYADRRSFSQAERRIAINDASPYRDPVRKLYPLLSRQGPTLREEGIEFHDATEIFLDVPEIVYADDCCHLNQRGNDRLADFLYRAIRSALEGRAPEDG